ncbi:MAG: hypothetical protein C0603_04950 [Denitrovibrio sp.]|nr:MAG: hypothetical protein C0603_04950 [Denitrovibrio sp.]
MDNTTKQILIFEDAQFFSQTPAGRHKMSDEELKNLKSGYALVISDTELFYTSMEFPNAPKRKLSLFISNYLMGSFPQQLCEKFCYFSKGDKILIGIFSNSFAESFNNHEEVFSKAAYITSPLANVYSNNDSFTYDINGLGITVEDGLITDTKNADDPIDPDWAISPETKLTIPFIKNRSAALNIYKVPLLVLLACYIVFFAGDYFRMKGHKDKLNAAENTLEAIYKKAGVSGSKDPYGKLLALAGGNKSGESYQTLFLLEKISKAHNENITTDMIEIKGESVSFQGSSSDFTYLEQFKKSLSDQLGKDVKIVDTIKKEGNINFTLRFDI